jgi:hypothetical protein
MGAGAVPALARRARHRPHRVPGLRPGAGVHPGRGRDGERLLWRQTTDDRWHAGAIDFPAGQEDPDGSEWLLELLLDDSPEAYRRFAEDYYELKSVNLAAVRQVYALRPLTQPLVTALNDQLSVADLAHDIAEIGYPTAQL